MSSTSKYISVLTVIIIAVTLVFEAVKVNTPSVDEVLVIAHQMQVDQDMRESLQTEGTDCKDEYHILPKSMSMNRSKIADELFCPNRNHVLHVTEGDASNSMFQCICKEHHEVL